MIKRFCNWILKIQTRNFRRVPLFMMAFDYQKFKTTGKAGSCTLYSLHPDLATDEFLKTRLQECVDHIRDNYDMERIVKL